MKCKVIKGINLDGKIIKPCGWREDYVDKVIEADGRNPEVKHYIEIGALMPVKEEAKNGRTQSS